MYLFMAIVGVPREMRDTFMSGLLRGYLARHRIEIVKSYTTGPRLSNEDYLYHVFVGEEEFRRRQASGEFFQVEQVDGALRGFRTQDIKDVIADGNAIALFDRLTNGKIDALKRLVGELTVLRPFLDEGPIGVGPMPQGMFFQKTGGSKGEPN